MAQRDLMNYLSSLSDAQNLPQDLICSNEMCAPICVFRQFLDVCFILEDAARVPEKPEDSLQVAWTVIASEGMCVCACAGGWAGRKGEAGVTGRERWKLS